MRNACWLLCWTTLFFLNCKQDTATTSAESKQQTSPVAQTTANIPLDISLNCYKEPTEGGAIAHTIALSINGKSLRIAQLDACQDIPKTTYTKYNIPSEALAACSGNVASTTKYFYVTRANDYVFIMRTLDQQQPNEDLKYELERRIKIQ